ncbi:DUF3667 domain-containing protein [Sphingobium algorifonticola]|uniref:DUF3667 domain-containing protein n=1 Tax=Sphingobium algorifonticola TaxID=2008318 RepID=A0A437J8S4_9SPHN|nr:DUF3667 domain-containing protein [Sphingobium algorifonticola]RVT41865.1 DUF3667 domain-containing protein [Sphingobium algorifonticola]
MSGEIEAAGDALTGGVIAGAVERESRDGAHGKSAQGHGACANCGAALTGTFCAQCGQAAHLHRSLGSLGHDILHGVFHFEGKIWRTLPELVFRPGRLTRRYIDGQRASFVSPMALFLFCVFLTFAVFSYTGGALLNTGSNSTGDMKSGLQKEVKVADERLKTIDRLQRSPATSKDTQAKLTKERAELTDEKRRLELLLAGDMNGLIQTKSSGEVLKADNFQVELGNEQLNTAVKNGLLKASSNPSLLIYKLKSNGYKYSWALIPLSIPFLWLLFFWRRDIHLYDHAIFATYSISFMLLLIVATTLVIVLGVPSGTATFALIVLPPIHMYKQLRGTYALSRTGAAVRLFFLLNFTFIVLAIFAVLLVLLGLTG